jgi:hypothetical protein
MVFEVGVMVTVPPSNLTLPIIGAVSGSLPSSWAATISPTLTSSPSFTWAARPFSSNSIGFCFLAVTWTM